MQNADIQAGLAAAGFQTTVTDVAEGASGRTGGLFLAPNVPNPFRESTVIRFLLPREGHVKLSVYDVAGREVARLVDDSRSAGPHDVELVAEGLSSGVYTYRLEAGGETAVKRFVYLR
jgi:hypothetical protein